MNNEYSVKNKFLTRQFVPKGPKLPGNEKGMVINMDERVLGKSVKINYEDTLSFFNDRGENKPLKHKYNYVLFQDDEPQVAIERDKIEKEKIGNLLCWEKKQSVLDIGCGIGRWGEEILKRGLSYVGVDYSEKLLAIGYENLQNYNGEKILVQGSFQELIPSLEKVNAKKIYDKIFINGVMMYLNDDDIEKAFEDVGILTGKTCEIYLKETVTLGERLTLNQFYSETLTHNYTAIYRCYEEYRKMIKSKWIDKYQFKLLEEGPLFPEHLKNRKETIDYYFVLRK